MTTYYKAVRMDYTDFYSQSTSYMVGSTVEHPKPHKKNASGYLSVTVDPTDAPGATWPLRMLEVEATNVWKSDDFKNKRCTHKLTVVREIDAFEHFGPQGEEVVEMFKILQDMHWLDRKALDSKLYQHSLSSIMINYAERASVYNLTTGVSDRVELLMDSVIMYDTISDFSRIRVDAALEDWDEFVNRGRVRKVIDRVRFWFKHS